MITSPLGVREELGHSICSVRVQGSNPIPAKDNSINVALTYYLPMTSWAELLTSSIPGFSHNILGARLETGLGPHRHGLRWYTYVALCLQATNP